MHILKYILTAAFIWFIGWFFAGTSSAFIAMSEPAELLVVRLDAKRDNDGTTKYRPVFALASAPAPRTEYAGNMWTAPAPHAVGDVVSGRHDPDTGKMQSDKMLSRGKRVGRIAQAVAAFIGLQGVALMLGLPEHRLPLPVRIGHRKRGLRVRP